jgi:hypothetical protein
MPQLKIFSKLKSFSVTVRTWFACISGGGRVSLNVCPKCNDLTFIQILDLDNNKSGICKKCGFSDGRNAAMGAYNKWAISKTVQGHEEISSAATDAVMAPPPSNRTSPAVMPTPSQPRGTRWIIPLLLTNDKETVEYATGEDALNFRKCLAANLGGMGMPLDKVPDFASNWPKSAEKFQPFFECPCVFVVYFREHGPLSAIVSPAFELLMMDAPSISIFFFLPTTGNSPLRVKVEETFLLNSGRTLTIHETNGFDEARQCACIAETKTAIEKCDAVFMPFYENPISLHLSTISLPYLLPYLRIFREEPSISAFYAAMEYLLMLNHLLLFIRVATTPPGERRSELDDRLLVVKRELSDGIFAKLLVQHDALATSPVDNLLDKCPEERTIGDLKCVLDTLDVALQLPRNPSWRDVCPAIVAIRNATKGHGVVYSVNNEAIRSILSIAVSFTKTIYEQQWKSLAWFKQAWKAFRSECFIYGTFASSTYDPRENMEMAIKIGEEPNAFGPFVRMIDGGDLLLYEGLSDDKRRIMYKRYATGIHLEIPVIEKKGEENLQPQPEETI